MSDFQPPPLPTFQPPLFPSADLDWSTKTSGHITDTLQTPKTRPVVDRYLRDSPEPVEDLAKVKTSIILSQLGDMDFKEAYERAEELKRHWTGDKDISISQWFKLVRTYWDSGMLQTRIGDLQYKMWQHGVSPELKERVENLKKLMPSLVEIKNSIPNWLITQTAQLLPHMLDVGSKGAWGGLATGLPSAGLAAMSGIAAGPAFLSMYGVGAATGSYIRSQQLMTSYYFGELIDRGVNENIARTVAGVTGALSATIEMDQIGIILKPFLRPGIHGARFVKRYLDNVATKLALNGRFPKVLLQIIGQYGGTLTREAIEEGAQKAIELLGEELAVEWSNVFEGTELEHRHKQIIPEVLKEMKQMFTAGALLPLIGLPVEISGMIKTEVAKKKEADLQNRGYVKTPQITGLDDAGRAIVSDVWINPQEVQGVLERPTIEKKAVKPTPITEKELSNAAVEALIELGFEDFIEQEERARRIELGKTKEQKLAEVERQLEDIQRKQAEKRIEFLSKEGPITEQEMDKEQLADALRGLAVEGYAGKGYSPIVIGYIRAAAKSGFLTDEQYHKALKYINQRPQKYREAIARSSGAMTDEEIRKAGYITSPEDVERYFAAQEELEKLEGRITKMKEGPREDIQLVRYEQERRRLTEWTKRAKTRIRNITGQIKLDNLVSEREALKAKMQAQQKASLIAYRLGKRTGISKQKAHQRAVKAVERERREQRKRLRKIINDLNGVEKRLGKMAPQFKKPIEDLLAGIDLVKRRKKTILRLEKTREFMENHPEAEMPDYVIEKLKLLDKKNLNDLTLNDLENIHDAVMHYGYLNQRLQQIRHKREWRRFQEVLSNSITEMKPIDKAEPDVIVSDDRSGIRKASEKLRYLFGLGQEHYDLVIEKLAGPNSTMDYAFFRDVKDGIRTQLKFRQNQFNRFIEELKEQKIDLKNAASWLDEKVKIGKWKLTRGERIALYMHSLNEDNLQSILKAGIGFRRHSKPDKVYKIMPNELGAILNSLTKQERVFAIPARTLFERLGKEYQKVFYEKNGYEMDIEPNYYHKDVMPVGYAKDFEQEEVLEKFRSRWLRIGIPKGRLKTRRRVAVPLYLNSIAYDINQAIFHAASYVGLEIPLSNAAKLLYNPRFKYELSTRYGRTIWKEIDQGLRDCAGEHKAYGELETSMQKLRANLSVAYLGLNPFVMLKQVLSYGAFRVYIKDRYLLKGLASYFYHRKETENLHRMYSPEFVERIESGFEWTLQEVRRAAKPTKIMLRQKGIRETMMGGIKWFDKNTVAAGMQAAVFQVLDEFKSGKLTKEVKTALDIEDSAIAKLSADEKMQLAYRFADYAVNRTQPTFAKEHRAALSKQEVAKWFTMFSSFTNQMLNLGRRTWYEAKTQGTLKSYAKMARFLSFMAANLVAVSALDRIRDLIYGQKPEGFVGQLISGAAGLWYFVRDIVRSAVSIIERGEFFGYDVEIPLTALANRAARFIANTYNAIVETSRKKRRRATTRAFWGAAEVILSSQGFPYRPARNILKSTIEQIK